MKVMVIVKATAESEAGKMPEQELFIAMGKFNEELVKAGLMDSGEGLKPSKEGFRVHFKGEDRTLTKGPFAETNELIAGYWIWNVSSMEEAIEWVKKCPNPMEDESDIEIRPFYEIDDFAEVDTTGEIREQEDGLRQAIAMQKSTANTYIFFPGCGEQALEYYQQHLGAKIEVLMRFKDSPEPMLEGSVAEEFENKIMHSEFTIGNARIFGSDADACGEVPTPTGGFAIALTIDGEEEARRAFTALADGGKVNMPLTPTFWSPLYGQVTDKFGTNWMIMLPMANN